MDTKWVKDSFDKGKLEILKFARASRIKIEITALNKKKDERIKLLGSKVMELVENGELDAELFEPDYSYIKNIESDISEKEEQLAQEDENGEEVSEQTEEESDKIDIVKIESQKVLTADSIPLPEEEEKTEKKDTDKDYTI